MLSRGQGSGKQLDDPSDAGVLVAAVALVGSRASASSGGGARGAGASAKGDAVPVVPVADLDNGAEQGAILGLSGVSVLFDGADPLENLGVVHILGDAAHRADDGAQREVDVGAEGLAGMLGDQLGEECRALWDSAARPRASR